MAQICAVIAFIISVAGWWLAWVAGLIAVIILLLECCVNVHRNGFFVAAICAVIAAVSQFLVAAGVVNYTFLACDSGCALSTSSGLIMAIIAGILWVIVAMTCHDYGC